MALKIILEMKLGISPNASVGTEANASIIVNEPRTCCAYAYDPGHWIDLMSSEQTINTPREWKLL